MERLWTGLALRAKELRQIPFLSRAPLLLILVLCVVALCKLLLVLMIQYMCDESMIVFTGFYPDTSPLLLALGFQWDTKHFVYIAMYGYPGAEGDTLYYSFAPLYPALIALTEGIVGNPCLAAVLISNVFYFLSLPLCYIVARLYMDYKPACLTTLALGVFPTYLAYGTLGYTEAPYMFFAILTWYLYKRNQMLLASAALTLSVLTRYTGLLMVPLLFLLSAGARFRKLPSGARMVQALHPKQAWLLVPVLALGILFLYFQVTMGDFFVVLRSHARFDDQLVTPFHQFIWFFTGFFTQLNPSINPVLLALERYAFTIPFFVLTLTLFKRTTESPDDTWKYFELGLCGLAYMAIVLSMQGISAVASPRIMLSSWVTMMALHREMSKAAMIAVCVLFFLAGLWVAFRFETTFFA